MKKDIYVFRSLSEIPFVSFPARLPSMLMAVCGRGEITARIDVTTRTMGANHVMVLRPGHLIDKCSQSADFEGFFITVSEDRLHHLLPSIQYVVPYSILYNGDPMIEITREEYDGLSHICSLFDTQLRNTSRPFASMALESLCELLFFDTLGIYAVRSLNLGHRSRRDELLAQFLELLEKNFRTERSVNFYADHLFVSPKHLSAVLKEVSGQTASEWIDHRVIIEAKLLLRSTGMTIQEVSTTLNFANQSFFGKYFKHLTGLSPRDYRTGLSTL